MSIVGSNALAGASGQSAGGGAAGYQINRSLRFNSGDSAYLNRTPSSAGNRKTFTWSGWVKRTALGADKFIFSAGSDASNMHYLRFKSNDTLEATEKVGDSVQSSLVTSAVYRDPSAWYHIVYVYDSTQSTAADRLSLYVNGAKVTAFGTSTYPSQNHDSYINSTSNHFINARPNPAGYADAYLAEIYLLDGTAVSDATDFGEYDTNNIWQPIDCKDDLTYGTNGFYLNFSDNSSSSALGLDQRPGATQDPTATTYGTIMGGSVGNVFDGVASYTSELDLRPNGSGVTLDTAVTASSKVRIYGMAESGTYQINGTSTGIAPSQSPTRGWTDVSSALTFPITISSFGIGGGSANDGGRLAAIELDDVILTGTANDFTVNNIKASGLEWASTTWSNNISIDSGNYYLSGNNGPKGFDGNTSTNIDCRLGTGANNTTNIIWEPTGGISGVTKIRVYSNFADDYRINNGSWTSFTSNGSWAQIYSGSAFTLTKLEIRRTTNSGSDYGHNVAAYELNDLEVLDDTAQVANDPEIDSLIDTPTNYSVESGNAGGNYCTLNPLDKNTLTLANGNLEVTGTTVNQSVRGTIFVSSGKWYYEATVTNVGTETFVGFAGGSYAFGGSTGRAVWRGQGNSGELIKLDASTTGSQGQYTTGDVIGCAIDFDNDRIDWYKNNTLTVSYTSAGLSSYAPLAPLIQGGGGSYEVNVNFGQRSFAYTPPSNHLAIVTTNLSDPTIADGSTYFDAFLYTGDGTSSRNITLPLAADFLWMKKRGQAGSHQLVDTVRGNNSVVHTNADIEARNPQTQFGGGGISSLSGTTATLSSGTSNNNNLNANTITGVGWVWDAGTVSNPVGDVWEGSATKYIGVKFSSASGGTISFGQTSGSTTVQVWKSSDNAYWTQQGGTLTLADGHTLTFTDQYVYIRNTSDATFTNWYAAATDGADGHYSGATYPSGASWSGPAYTDYDWREPGGTLIAAGSLNSTAYNQTAVWSGMCSPTPSINSFTNGFDGSLTTTFAGGISAGSYFTFTPTGGITFTDKVRVYNGAVSGASYKYNNGSATTFPTNSWTTVATGGGTMTSFAVTRSGTDVHGWYAIEVDGKILVDQGATPAANVPATTSICRTNQTAGFSIVSYKGNSVAGSKIGHNLNAQPSFILLKNRDRAINWAVGHLAANSFVDGDLNINTTNAKGTGYIGFFGAEPTSSVFTVQGNYESNYANEDYIAYCFSPVEGYSAFPSHTVSSGTNFVYLGFRPRLVMLKRLGTGTTTNISYASWAMFDTERDTYNEVDFDTILYANRNHAQGKRGDSAGSTGGSYLNIDILSNGIRFQSGAAEFSQPSDKIIVMAWAENPFSLNGGLAR